MSTVDDHTDQILLSPAEALAAVSAWEQQTALLALALRRIETNGTFGVEGAVSMKAWLREKARMTNDTAGNLLSLGRFLDNNTAFADAALTGQMSGGQLSVAKRLGRPKYAALLAQQQHDLVGTLATLGITNTMSAVAHWRSRADALLDDGAPPIDPPRELHLARTLDQRLHGTLDLDDAAATELEKAIQNAQTWEGTDDLRSVAQRQGDALFDVAAFYNTNHDGDGTPRHLPTITLSADASTITTDVPEATNDDTGRPISPACTATYLCDCKIHVILRDANGAPEHFGRTTYSVPRTLFRQVAARDGGCRFPGCNRPVRFTDAHHINPWEHGGPTDYDNLMLLCRRHHTFTHQQRLTVKLLPNGSAHFTWHDGTHRTSEPRGAPPTRPSG
jgi:hypothetical protein